jgi:hypothetical protein
LYKVDFKPTLIEWGKEGHFILIKGEIHQKKISYHPISTQPQCTQLMPCILSDHNALKQELNNKNNSKKHAKNWKLRNTFLNDQWVIE